MGGGSTSTTNTQSQQVNQIPEWVQNAGQQNYALAQQIAQQPLQQYQGQMVAGISPQTQQAWNLAANSGNVGADQFNASTAGYLNALGQTPANVRAGQLSNTNLQPYMNPFTRNVINTTLPIMQEELGKQQAQLGGNATQQNAFGGSRFGNAQGVLGAQGAQNMAQMAAQLNQANFGQAQAAATGDINRRLQAAQGNQTAQQAKINSDIAASQGLTNTGTQMGQQNAANYAMLTSAGAQQQQQAQNQINAQMAKFAQAWQYPQQGLGLMLSALNMTPYNTAQTGSSTSTTETSQSPNFASMALGGLQTLGSLFGGPAGALAGASDKRVKTDITHLGKDPVTGVPVKSFRFKGQLKSMPKTIGPLAQDVEKAAPGSTVKIGGIMHVPRPTLAAATPSVAHLPTFATRMPSVSAFTPPSSPGVARGILAMSGRAPMTPPSSPGVAKGIASMSAFMPPMPSGRTHTAPRAGARGIKGALANTKRSPRVMGALGHG